MMLSVCQEDILLTAVRDSLLSVCFPNQKLPLSVTETDFIVPFPEYFDQHLGGHMSPLPPDAAADGNNDRIAGMVWPESYSAWYLSTLLRQIHCASNPPPTVAERNALSHAVSAHTMDTMSKNWRFGSRCATTAMNFM